MRSKLTTTRWTAALLVALLATTLGAQEPTGPRFRSDDPIRTDDDRAVDASGASRRWLSAYADFVVNTFMAPGDRRPLGALNVNTLGEVPDSSWFTNRVGAATMSVDDVVRGPDRVARLEVRRWLVVEGKDSGRQPGFRAVDADDPDGPVYQLEFDPPGNPEMATGAEIIGTAIYHALGYNVVETYLVEVDGRTLSVAPNATIDIGGRARRFTERDVEQVLRRAARRPDGRYRASASRFAEGRNLGPFRYHGTRPDDPNDIYPHEHRRELRGNRVFAAWLNHDDSRAGNTLDMLVDAGGRRYVKHYMFDFGSMLGSGTSEEDHPWVGHEYVVEGRPALLTLASFGLWRRPFIRADAPSDLPAAGNFTADGFSPAAWRPHYPNAAFGNMQAEDAFWAARLVAALSPDAIARIVEKARFSDPAVTDHVTGTLMRRRAAVLRTWLPAVNPIVDLRIERDGMLRFGNAAIDASVVAGPVSYDVSWFRFDNVTERRRYAGPIATVSEPAVAVPTAELGGAEYVGVDIRTRHAEHAAWSRPVRAYFRTVGDAWTLVGLERQADTSDERTARR